MRTVPACLACILGDVYAAAGQVAKDEAEALRVARDSLAFLAEEFGLDRVPSYYITEVHRILKRDTGVAVPFADSRRQLNQIGLDIARRIWAEAERRQGRERFRFLATWALAGNSLDSRTVGIGYGFDPEKTLEHLRGYVDRGLARDDLDALHAGLQDRPAVLYVHDNVGEVALDALLIRELRGLGCRVTSALRGGPITSDATLEDGRMVDMAREADGVILAGPDTLGISWEEASPALRDALASAGLIIAKGQANYYVFSEHRREVPGDVICLFTIKCQPVADVVGVQPRQAVAMFLR
jgi:uncharacterized protein with ATP-grasp and redox domains